MQPSGLVLTVRADHQQVDRVAVLPQPLTVADGRDRHRTRGPVEGAAGIVAEQSTRRRTASRCTDDEEVRADGPAELVQTAPDRGSSAPTQLCSHSGLLGCLSQPLEVVLTLRRFVLRTDTAVDDWFLHVDACEREPPSPARNCFASEIASRPP